MYAEQWQINQDLGFLTATENKSDAITEIPVMTLKKEKINQTKRLFTSLKYRTYSLIYKSRSIPDYEGGKPFKLGIKKHHYPISITFDKSTDRDLILMKFFSTEYLNKNCRLMCILSHPKSFYRQSFKVFEEYLKWLKKNKHSYSVCGFHELP